MKGQKFLKVTGILMIIGAALSILFGVIIGGVGALIAKFAGASTLGFAFYLGLATTLVGGIIQLIAGINGVKHCNKPENAACFILRYAGQTTLPNCCRAGCLRLKLCCGSCSTQFECRI